MQLYKDKNPDYSAYLSKTWGIPEETIIWYHGGNCYDTVLLTTKEAADKVSEYLKKSGEKVNGGYFHGMSLGGIDPETVDGITCYRVMC